MLSLITGTRNRPAGLKRLIDSVIRHTSVSYEFLIGDASDQPQRLDVPPNIVIWPEKPRLGHSRGYNRLFRLAQGDYLLWLNDDAEVTEGYAENALRFMTSHPRIGLGCLHYSEPSNGLPYHWNSAWECGYANFGIFPRQLGQQVGFFDEDIYMYGADNSLALRILLAGYGIGDIPDAKIIHHSDNDELRKENQAGRIQDNRILTKKYMPTMKQWQAAYRLYGRESTPPWSHGRQPVAR